MSRKYRERPADLTLWLGDGTCGLSKASIKAGVEVSVGRTNSKRGMGFLVSVGEQTTDFVHPGWHRTRDGYESDAA
jgi:hypothetical protein